MEFYFSDANILKDAFLLKHVRRNRQGYVSLKLITSFKKVKSLTKDFRAVAYSLRQSDKLEVSCAAESSFTFFGLGSKCVLYNGNSKGLRLCSWGGEEAY